MYMVSDHKVTYSKCIIYTSFEDTILISNMGYVYFAEAYVQMFNVHPNAMKCRVLIKYAKYECCIQNVN